MKVVILAGGLGTRLSEETRFIPKPMVEIGGKPILWHIMKLYSYYGFNDFIILSGYKSHIIKEYFVNYYQRYSDITVDMQNNSVEIHKMQTEPWKVTILYTGQNTMTGGRIKKAQQYIGNERFLLTYGDGISDVNILETIDKHEKSNKILSVLYNDVLTKGIKIKLFALNGGNDKFTVAVNNMINNYQIQQIKQEFLNNQHTK